MVGRTPDVSYSSFLSPAYRSAFDAEGLKQLDSGFAASKTPSTRYPECKSKDVRVQTEGRFAYTAANPDLGDAYRSLGATRWVRAGRQWYLYTGSQAEI